MTERKVLRKVTDRFSLFDDGREYGANGRNYVVSSFQRTLANPKIQEEMKLGEMFGYWGHVRRELANKLRPRETEVIMVEGKPVIVDNVPSHRTIACTCSDEGIIEHTQEIFDNPMGQIVSDAVDNGFGGWSWATSGRDGHSSSSVHDLGGFDFVGKPNYRSIDTRMLEGAEGEEDKEQLMLESMLAHDIDEEEAKKMLAIAADETPLSERMAGYETERLMLEGMYNESQEQVETLSADVENKQTKIDELNSDVEKRQTMMLEAIDAAFPYYMTDEQKRALSEMKTEEDKQVVEKMFESLNSGKLQTLPHSARAHEVVNVNTPESNNKPPKPNMQNSITFAPKRYFGKDQ